MANNNVYLASKPRYEILDGLRGVAAMTDWTLRDLTVDLSFLGSGQHQAEIFADGINATKEATDYQRIHKTVNSTDHLSIHFSSGGGWTAIIQ